MVTMPTEADWNNPELRTYIEEALPGNAKYTVEERLKVMSLAQDLAASRMTGTLGRNGTTESGNGMIDSIRPTISVMTTGRRRLSDVSMTVMPARGCVGASTAAGSDGVTADCCPGRDMADLPDEPGGS